MDRTWETTHTRLQSFIMAHLQSQRCQETELSAGTAAVGKGSQFQSQREKRGHLGRDSQTGHDSAGHDLARHDHTGLLRFGGSSVSCALCSCCLPGTFSLLTPSTSLHSLRPPSKSPLIHLLDPPGQLSCLGTLHISQ
jgi:hypothetical protein